MPYVNDTAHPPRAQVFQPMPSLSPEQYAALRDDIAEHGVRVPIVVDQHGRILDGNNRSRIAAELGITCPSMTQVVADDDEAIDIAVSLNCARRHLNREQRRQVIQQEIGRRPGDSDRAIARRVGCDHKTVGSIRRGGEIPHAQVTREEAEKRADEIREHLRGMGENLLDLIATALSNKIAPLDIIRSLNAAARHYGERDQQAGQVIRDAVFQPLIDLVLDPEWTAVFRVYWDHPTFKPLTDDEANLLLAGIAMLGGDPDV